MADMQGRKPYGAPEEPPRKPDVVVENRQSPLIWIILLAVAVLVVLWLTGVFDRDATTPADTTAPPAVEDVQDALDEAGEGIRQGLDDAGNAVNQGLNDVGNAIQQGLDDATEGAEDLLGN